MHSQEITRQFELSLPILARPIFEMIGVFEEGGVTAHTFDDFHATDTGEMLLRLLRAKAMNDGARFSISTIGMTDIPAPETDVGYDIPDDDLRSI